MNDILRKICDECTAGETPKKVTFFVPYVEILIPINDDETASLIMSREAYEWFIRSVDESI